MTKVIILAGGLGTRLSEETSSKPKPMVEIGDKPILWHLMNIFSIQGFSDFVIALGYKGDVIKRWFRDLQELEGDLDFNFTDRVLLHKSSTQLASWKVSLIETGIHSMTSERLRICMTQNPGEQLIATYGDGLANINIKGLLEFHASHGKLATVTAVRPPARFGNLRISDGLVTDFEEKPQTDEGWINGGFFVLEPGVLDYFEDTSAPFEHSVLPLLAKNGQLMAFQHEAFWKPMDTLREKREFDTLVQLDLPPWLDF